MTPGVSFVVPVRDGARTLSSTLESIAAQACSTPVEIIVVEDGSRDTSLSLIERFAEDHPLILLAGPRRGAAAALNHGIRAARFELVAQVDQDVELREGWLETLREALEDPEIAAAQGWFETPPGASLWARVAGLDLELRYARIEGRELDHVCTGNTLYRRSALLEVGLFDETFGYGYDNDLAYRLRGAGYRLGFGRAARSRHHWRPDLASYLRQQYGQGYGRLDLVAKHPGRMLGDRVSGPAMIGHVPLAALAAGSLLGALLRPGRRPALGRLGGVLTAGLAIERLLAGLEAQRRFGDPAALAFPVAHLLRDGAWLVAAARWTVARARGRGRSPWATTKRPERGKGDSSNSR